MTLYTYTMISYLRVWQMDTDQNLARENSVIKARARERVCYVLKMEIRKSWWWLFGKPLPIFSFLYVLWVFLGGKNTSLETAPLFDSLGAPSLTIPPPSAKSSVLSDLQVFKELISSTSHFSIPSTGYGLQINQNRYRTQICPTNHSPKGRKRLIKTVSPVGFKMWFCYATY